MIQKVFLRTGLKFVLAACVLLACAIGHSHQANSDSVWHANNPAYSDTLILKNHCWTSTQPQGAHAHRVVVQRPGGRLYVAGQKVTDYTLNHILNGKELPLGWTVFAYCDKVSS